jgi:hypothetical protein
MVEADDLLRSNDSHIIIRLSPASKDHIREVNSVIDQAVSAHNFSDAKANVPFKEASIVPSLDYQSNRQLG